MTGLNILADRQGDVVGVRDGESEPGCAATHLMACRCVDLSGGQQVNPDRAVTLTKMVCICRSRYPCPVCIRCAVLG